MPHNKNTDRTRRRLLRWVALLGCFGVAGYLFFPHLFTEQSGYDTAADPFADSLAHDLPPESVDLPPGAPELPPLIPPALQDDELLAQLANEYNLQSPDFGGQAPDPRYIVPVEEIPPETDASNKPASTPTIAENASTPDLASGSKTNVQEHSNNQASTTSASIGARDLTDEARSLEQHKTIADHTLKLEDGDTASGLLDLARIGARDLTHETPTTTTTNQTTRNPPKTQTRTSSAPPAKGNADISEQNLATIGARDLSGDIPENAVEIPAVSNNTTEMVLQDDSKGEFVKKRFSLQKPDIWTALQKSDLNPNLKRQLEPLRRRIAQSNINRVQILYTDYMKDGESKPENSKILLVDGMRGSTLVWSFYAREKDRKMSFYDYDGNAPEFAMDRVPLPHIHITSEFNPARRHPVTGRIQAHTGVDLKAAYGAPVYSTGKGIVSFAGWQSGYGRIVIVQHDNGYETRYAHLSAIDVEAGQTVARGAVVGKVGNSGISTGTHLHFEVRINDIPHDPMTVKIPSSQPLPGNYLKAWHYRAEQYRLAMNELSRTVKK